jgi:hypothetical protein
MRTYLNDINADFTCKHCGIFVSAMPVVSGVVNRNHCPICLYSRHVDLFKPGDRLCACKGLMAPVGLTLKQSRDKYVAGNRGELMLIHHCTACGVLSINRIAADDDPVGLMEVFNRSLTQGDCLYNLCEAEGIQLLNEDDHYLVEMRLYGIPV